jgi:DNA repair protein RadD
MLTLRPYQHEAIEAVYRHLRERDDNPVVVIPTAGGKTPILATICKDAVSRWNGRVLILAHVKELLEQAADKLRAVCPEVKFGVYSAGLKRRDTEHAVIVAGIQSVYRRACELDAFDLVIVDEAHLIPTSGDGMYRQFLAEAKVVNPHVRVIGLTATPFRLDSGAICAPDHFLNAICYEISVKELIRDGFLCPLITKAGLTRVDTSELHVRAGEFVAEEVERLMDQDNLVLAACREIVAHTQDRKKCLIFAAGVAHGRHIVDVLRHEHGIDCGFVCGDTPSGERAELIARFRDEPKQSLFQHEPLKYLCNVNVLTTGFDAPNIDCVALLRPTASAGLYYQAVGRGFRLHPGKQDCLVLDFGGNVLRHGPVDQLKIKDKSAGGTGEAPAKECPECHLVIAAGYTVCPDCGYQFPPPERQRHEAQATEAGILSGQITTTIYKVEDVFYGVHTKRGAGEDAPKSMRVDYRVALNEYKSEWICFEHTGYARWRAEQWWRKRSPDPVPDTAERAVELAGCGALATTSYITVRTVAGDPYERIIDYEIGPKPEPCEAYAAWGGKDEIPF